MIKISPVEPTTASWKKWRQSCIKKTTSDLQKLINGDQLVFTDLYKAQKNFYIDVAGPFRGKCAYCEAKITRQYGDVEHYRPKGAVQHEDRSSVMVSYDGNLREHPGYYWLAYDWTNLLPSCVICNSGSEGFGKGVRFPVDGAYAFRPGDEGAENPKLLHPCYDEPDDHLSLDSTGVIVEKTERGRATKDVLGLNERNLPRDRCQKWQDILERIDRVFARSSDHAPEWIISELQVLQTDDQEYAAVARAAVRQRLTQIVRSAQVVLAGGP
jgi:hypothetical protein